MKKNSLFNFVLLALIAFPLTSFADMKNAEKFTIINSKGEEIVFMLEVANTPEKQTSGLSNRDELNEGEGMVFPARPNKIFTMWMKDTRIPLDMLFVDYSGEIQHIHWEAKPYSEETISFDLPVRAVIELKGGVTIDKDINPGDKVINPMFYAGAKN